MKHMGVRSAFQPLIMVNPDLKDNSNKNNKIMKVFMKEFI